MENVSKYATLLSPKDVLELFNLLEKNLGSHKAAAIACGLTRKTPYDWYSARDLKFDTKAKLLKALMEKLPEETLEYLTSLSVDNASDILMSYISTMYESSISVTERELFIKKLEHFAELRNQHAGLIAGRFDAEVSDAIMLLKQKAKEFHFNWIPLPSPMMTIDQACILVPIIIKEVLTKIDVTDKIISHELNVFEELVRSIRSALQQTLSLSGVIPSDLRRMLADLNRTITSITDPTPSFTLESSNIAPVTAITPQEQIREKSA